MTIDIHKIKRIRILAFYYGLVWWSASDMDVAGAHGWCNTGTLKIGLCEDQEIQRVKQTLLHEILHAVNDQLQMQEGGNDEDIASRLSVGLITVARDNPEVWQWIFSN